MTARRPWPLHQDCKGPNNKPDRTDPKRLAARMLPVEILGTVALIMMAYILIGSMLVEDGKQRDDRAERRAQEQRVNND